MGHAQRVADSHPARALFISRCPLTRFLVDNPLTSRGARDSGVCKRNDYSRVESSPLGMPSVTIMHWKAKAHALAVLSRIPFGRRLYHGLQRVGRTNRLDIRRELARAFELAELVHASGGRLAGTTFLEIGTGWRPIVPFVLALAGAKQVITLDVNPWLTATYAREAWRALTDHLEEIADVCAADPQDVQHRFEQVSPTARQIQELLTPVGIDYRCPTDARRTGLPDNSVDVVVSSNVLEHIPRGIQRDIQSESMRVLRPGGLTVHRFNPQDHFSTVDESITHANFLKFSSRQWYWYGGSGLAYQNRLRSRDYRELFESAGFETVIDRERVDERTLRAIEDGDLKVHPDFAAYTPNELAVDYMWIACRKPVRAGARSPFHGITTLPSSIEAEASPRRVAGI